MANYVYDFNQLPTSPKRLAKAAATNRWTWNASYASGQDETGKNVDSIVVRCSTHDVRVVARWEMGSNGRLALAIAWHYVAGQWPRQVNLAQAIAAVGEIVSPL